MFAHHRVYGPELTENELPSIANSSFTFRRGGQFIPTPFSFIDQFRRDFQAAPDDLWICSYPKTGTSWLSEVVYWLRAAGDQAAVEQLKARNRELGLIRMDLFMYQESDVQPRLENLTKATRPRILVNHLAEGDMPPQVFTTSKVLVPLRNPKDTCVSYFHFHRGNTSLGKFRGTIHDFLPEFIRGTLVCGDFYDFNQKYWSSHSDNERVMFVHYEDMMADREAAIRRVAQFMGVEADDDLVKVVAERTHFDDMKSRLSKLMTHIDSTISPFFRKGITKDWKNHFTVAENEMFDKHHREVMSTTPDLLFRGME